MSAWEAVIGLEVHAQLLTKSKLFCGCQNRFGATPNANTCEVCLGMPGVLPVPNGRAVELAVRAAVALGCTVSTESVWARKNYFYPDLPKGYQISQFDKPLAEGGGLDIEHAGAQKHIRLIRIHMEEDAGKNVHDDVVAGGRSYVDFNRGGTPLVEIVSAPDLRSPGEAADYLRALRQLLRYLEVCDGNMDEGSLRCDANVSIRPMGEPTLGTRVELKNINSFRHVEQAIAYEIDRQREARAAGQGIVQETRLWDSEAAQTRSMRKKEEAHDYRYFPEPDLPPLTIAKSFIDGVRAALPELPQQKRRRYVEDLGLSAYDAGVLTEEPMIARWFEGALAVRQNPQAVANWLTSELLGKIADKRVEKAEVPSELLAGVSGLRPMVLDDLPFAPTALGELVALIDEGTISGKIAKEVLAELVEKGGSARAIVKSRGLVQVSDSATLEPIVAKVIADHPDSVAKYRAGKQNVLGFFVGQVMRATGGKANPALVNELVKKHLG